MDRNLNTIKSKVYDTCGLLISNFQTESESKEYNACRFELNGLKIISRNAKVTPKKAGLFVTFWKRNKDEITEPIHASDDFDFYAIPAKTETHFGQFVFPKSVLIAKEIVSTDKKDGKRGFRVYPAWDTTKNKQANTTQKWQLDYFYEIGESMDLKRITELYK
jgi:hypothetical protein